MSQELFFGSLGGWVSWGLYHSYLFFFFFFLNSYQIQMCSPTNTEQFFFCRLFRGLNHLLLHHLFLSSSFHLSRFLPPLHPHPHPHHLRLHQLLRHVQIPLPPH